MKKTLLVLLGIFCIVTAYAQWSNNPAENNQITPDEMTLYSTELAVSKDGITYILFLHPTGNIATRLHILDQEGNMLFPQEGLLISHKRTSTSTVVNDLLWTDSDGNAIIAVHDYRNASSDSNNSCYYVYKVSPRGEFLWDENGIDIQQGRSFSNAAWLKMVQLEDGSYVFAWIAYEDGTPSIHMQRVSKDGEPLWDNLILGEENVPYSTPFLVNGGNNQVILVYTRGTNQDLMAKKIDFDGTEVWSTDTRIYRAGFGTIPLQGVVTVISDNNGGAFVGWYDDRDWDNIEDVYVAHVLSNGTLGFTGEDNGLRIEYSDYRGNKPLMTYKEDEGCLYVAWRQEGNQYRMAGQKISLSGELMWDPEGKELAPFTEGVSGQSYTNGDLMDGPDGQVCFFYEYDESYQDTRIYAKLIDTDAGNPVWDNEAILISTIVSYKSSFTISDLIDNSYWLVMWKDDRISGSLMQTTLYVQRINVDGTYGTIIQSVLPSITKENPFAAIPSVIEEATEFVFDNKTAGNVDISIYSINGQKIATAYHGFMNEGMQSVKWNAQKVPNPSGIYIVTLNTAEGIKSIRIIVK